MAAADGGPSPAGAHAIVKVYIRADIEAEALPGCARLIRGWSGRPLGMVQELEASFSAVLMIGYHAKAGSADNPLAHTLWQPAPVSASRRSASHPRAHVSVSTPVSSVRCAPT